LSSCPEPLLCADGPLWWQPGANLATFGGVYIAGGIVPRFLEFFKSSGFRVAFEDKGRFQGYLKDIPVYLITHDQPGLLGAGAYLRQSLGIKL